MDSLCFNVFAPITGDGQKKPGACGGKFVQFWSLHPLYRCENDVRGYAIADLVVG